MSFARAEMGPLEPLFGAIRAATRVPVDWDATVRVVTDQIRDCLPGHREVLAAVPAEARHGHDRSQVLHVEPDGTFSVVAMISRPGQATGIHDHTTWCVVALVAGSETEERFRLDDDGTGLELLGVRTDQPGVVSGFAPPGDIHRVTNGGDTVSTSLHVYGTDVDRIGTSVRRTYDLPIRDSGVIRPESSRRPRGARP